jgi:hypothetical protein
VSASRAAISRASGGGTNRATSVGARTLPKTRALSSHTKGNIPAFRYWERGFGTILMDGLKVVPFTEEATCRRIAALAEADMKEPMNVRFDDEMWAYRPADEARL